MRNPERVIRTGGDDLIGIGTKRQGLLASVAGPVHFDGDEGTSRLVVAPFTSDAAGSVVALMLADAACDDGQRVLLVDCDGADSALSRCVQRCS